MQNDTSRFVVNIIPLQNIQSNVSGLDSTAVLSNEVAAIKRMINPQLNTVFTNTITSYTTGGTIHVTSPISLCNATATATTSVSNSTSNLSALSTVVTVYPTQGSLSTVFNIATASSSSAMRVSEGGDLSVSGSGTFSGICYANQFVTLSDMMAKTGIREWRSPVLNDLQKLHPYVFSYSQTPGEEIGLMAQEVGGIWPQLVKEGVKGTYVNYDGLTAILLKAIQELTVRVSSLEGV